MMHKNRPLQKIQDDTISEQRQKHIRFCRIASRDFMQGCVQKHHQITLGCHSIFVYVQWTMKIKWLRSAEKAA